MLVENYRQNGVDGRPVVNTSTALTVTISFSLIQILQFDATQQVITVVGWISLVRLHVSLLINFFSCGTQSADFIHYALSHCQIKIPNY